MSQVDGSMATGCRRAPSALAEVVAVAEAFPDLFPAAGATRPRFALPGPRRTMLSMAGASGLLAGKVQAGLVPDVWSRFRNKGWIRRGRPPPSRSPCPVARAGPGRGRWPVRSPLLPSGRVRSPRAPAACAASMYRSNGSRRGRLMKQSLAPGEERPGAGDGARLQAVRRHPGARRRLPGALPRRDPRAAGRERRRQVDPDQDHDRGPAARTAARSASTAQPVRVTSSQDAQRLGVAAIYQEPMIFPDLSVAENIFIGHRNRGKIVDRRRMEREASEVLARLDVRLDVGEPARGLTLAEQQTVEIAKAISLDVRVLIMDEPTASLSAHEVRQLFRIVAHAAPAGRGDPLHLPPHGGGLRDRRPRHDPARRPLDLDHAARRADARARPSATWSAARCVELFRRERREPGAVRLAVRGLRREGAFQDVSFELRAGEVLGFAGLVGARRTDVGLALFGIAPADGGAIELDGSPVTVDQSARRHGARASPTAPRTGGSSGSSCRSRSPPTSRCRRCRASCRAVGLVRRAEERATAEAFRQRLQHPRAVGRYAGVVAVRRQPAEGRHQQVAGDEAQGADPRRADPRHRRRRQGRGPPADRRPGGAGAWRSSSSARTCPRCWP